MPERYSPKLPCFEQFVLTLLNGTKRALRSVEQRRTWGFPDSAGYWIRAHTGPAGRWVTSKDKQHTAVVLSPCVLSTQCDSFGCAHDWNGKTASEPEERTTPHKDLCLRSRLWLLQTCIRHMMNKTDKEGYFHTVSMYFCW